MAKSRKLSQKLPSINKKSSPLDPALANLISDQMIEDFIDLCKLLDETMTDKAFQNEISKIIIELKALQKAIQKKKEYSPEQVAELTSMISKIGHKLVRMSVDPEKFAEEKMHTALAAFNGGKTPIKNLQLKMDLTSEFKENMKKIKDQCQLIGEDAIRLLSHAKGHRHSPIEKLVHAMDSCKESVLSAFKFGMSVVKDVQYTAKRAAAFTGLRELSLDDHKEHFDRLSKKAEKGKQKYSDLIEGQELLKEQRANKEREGKPTIFKKG